MLKLLTDPETGPVAIAAPVAMEEPTPAPSIRRPSRAWRVRPTRAAHGRLPDWAKW